MTSYEPWAMYEATDVMAAMDLPEAKTTPAKPLSDPELWVEQHGDYLFRYPPVRLRDPARAEDML